MVLKLATLLEFHHPVLCLKTTCGLDTFPPRPQKKTELTKKSISWKLERMSLVKMHNHATAFCCKSIFPWHFWRTINIKMICYRQLSFKIEAIPTKNCFCLFQDKPHFISEPFVNERQTTLHVAMLLPYSCCSLFFLFCFKFKAFNTAANLTIWGTQIHMFGFKEESKVHILKAKMLQLNH